MPNAYTWLTSAAFGACLMLTACGGSDEPAPSFAPPDYSYLSKLRLNVGTLTIEDHAGPTGDAAAAANELGPMAPVPPDQALQQMAHDRLVAAGNSSSAVFTIDQASITGSGGGTLDGRLAVHLDILTASGGHAGYAEAHVSRKFVPGAGTADDGTRARLYGLTQQMMQDMNVELEYQIRRSLREWLVDASGAPIAGSVEQQTLAPPSADALGADAPGADAPGAVPPGTGTPGAGTPVGTTPVGAVPIGGDASAPGLSGASQGPGPVPLAPPQGAAPGVSPLPDPAAPTRSPPPTFLQPPAGSTLPPPAAATSSIPPGGTGY